MRLVAIQDRRLGALVFVGTSPGELRTAASGVATSLVANARVDVVVSLFEQ